MKSILIDAGPLIALFRRKDKYHESALAFVKDYEGTLLTTWPVITEVMHILNQPVVQEKFLLWLDRGGLEIVNLGNDCIKEFLFLIRKYENVPMDLADASLILLSQKTGIREIATIDSDFYVYRTCRNEYLENIFRI